VNRQIISDAFALIDDAYIEECIVYRSVGARSASERNVEMNRCKKNQKQTRIMVVAGIVACLLLSMAFTASAANLWGIRDYFESLGRELPNQADEYIQYHSVSAQGEEFSCCITETLSDGKAIVAAVEVECSESYVLVPINSSPTDPADAHCINSEKTLAEYAAENNKTLLMTGAYIENCDIGAMQFERITDNKLVVMVRGEMEADSIQTHGVCTVRFTGGNSGSSEVQLEFEIAAAPKDSAVYLPIDPKAVCGVEMGAAIVTESVMGSSIVIEETVIDSNAFSGMEFRCGELTGYEGGSVNKDGQWYLNLTYGQGELNDTLTIRVYNCETGEHIGDIVFKKVM